ncbi:unnamed protein product [Cuscuta europaea]|nr:unnamed protein product [Cuscuta europaea]
MRSAKSRLTVKFDFDLMQGICDNTEVFNNEVGYILRTYCDLKYKEWRFVPEEERAPLRDKLRTLFDVDLADANVRKAIDKQMQRAWHNYRRTLREHFKTVGGAGDLTKAKGKPYEGVSESDWEYLCNCWSDPSYLQKALKNAESCKKRKWISRNGSKSTARHHISRGVELNAHVGHIETWRLRHWHPERGWVSVEAESKYEEMMEFRREKSPEDLTDKQILEKVLGRESVRLFGWGRSPTGSKRSKGDSNIPTYTQLMDRVGELSGTVEMMKKLLIEKNIMPPMSHVPSDHCSVPLNRGSSSIDRGQHVDGFEDSTSEYDNIV